MTISTAPYPVLDVSAWEVAEHEQIGKNEKIWLWDGRVDHSVTGLSPRESDKWLYKPNRPGGRSTEDWPEKIVSELGALLGTPCAEVQLAQRSGRRGVLSRNVKPDGWAFVSGAVALAGHIDGYVGGDEKPRGRPGHSLLNIRRLLDGYGAPPGSGLAEAFDVFVGYLTLDAWVANTDRHDQNWAVIERPSGERALAASFDHATSFGSGMSDDKRSAALDRSAGVYEWACRGLARKFEHDATAPGSAPTLVAFANDGLRMVSPAAREHWLQRLDAVSRADVEAVVARVAGLSDPTARFILEVAMINRGRLLDGHRRGG